MTLQIRQYGCMSKRVRTRSPCIMPRVSRMPGRLGWFFVVFLACSIGLAHLTRAQTPALSSAPTPTVNLILEVSNSPTPQPTVSQTPPISPTVNLSPTKGPTLTVSPSFSIINFQLSITPTPSPQTVRFDPSALGTPDVSIAPPVPIVTIPFGLREIRGLRLDVPASPSARLTVKKYHNSKSASKVTLAGQSQLVLEEVSAQGTKYQAIASEDRGLIDDQSIVDQYEGTVIWVGALGHTLQSYNLDTGGYSSSTIDETGRAQLVFTTPNSERIRATYDGSTFSYENLTKLARELGD